MIESKCGLCCSKCNSKFLHGIECSGCMSSENPFWGKCEIKSCCEQRGINNCGKCRDFPCTTLNSYSYDKVHGDNGSRIEQCIKWKVSYESEMRKRLNIRV